MLTTALDFLATHPFGVVFCSSLIEAAGVPFPSRVILILAPAFLETDSDLVRLAIVATLGAVLGDHVPYLAGRLAGLRILAVYCKLTLASDRCVEKTLRYFARFGAAALLLSRFSTSVRIFASACAGCGHITYPRYLTHRHPRLLERVGARRGPHRRARGGVLHHGSAPLPLPGPGHPRRRQPHRVSAVAPPPPRPRARIRPREGERPPVLARPGGRGFSAPGTGAGRG